MLLALLALALPTAALANSFTFDTGGFQNGRISGGRAGVTVDVIGANLTIVLVTGDLTLDSTCFVAGATCYSWPSGGTVEVLNTANGLVFQDTLKGGIIATTGVITPRNFLCSPSSCSLAVAAGLEPSARVDEGSTTFSIVDANGAAGLLVAGGAAVTFQKVPEPATLEGLLLGTGIVGLVEMTRRKLQLGT